MDIETLSVDAEQCLFAGVPRNPGILAADGFDAFARGG
jgi:hypothetical protein